MDSFLCTLTFAGLLIALVFYWFCFRILGHPAAERPRYFAFRILAAVAIPVMVAAGIGILLTWSLQPSHEVLVRQQAQRALIKSGWELVGLSELGFCLQANAPDHVTRKMIQQLSLSGTPGVLVVNAPEFDDDMLEMLEQSGSLDDTFFLDLDGTKITDRAVRVILRIPKLRWLVLNNTRLTDEGLWRSRGLSKLEFLSVVGSATTDAGLKRFRHARPDVKIDRRRRQD